MYIISKIRSNYDQDTWHEDVGLVVDIRFVSNFQRIQRGIHKMAAKFSCDIPALLIISALLQEKLCGKSPNQKHQIESLSLVIWWNMVEKQTSFCRMRAIQNLMLMVGSIFIVHQRPTFLDESIASRSFHTVSVENIAGDTLVRLNDLSNKKQRSNKCIYLFARSAREKE